MALIYSVEDDKSISELLECTMEASGYDMRLFEDAESMLERLNTEQCDLILLDIMLPKMDGITALKLVKEKHPFLPVILLSAKGSEVNKVKGLEAGADDYISKPFGVLELLARIKARLRKPLLSLSFMDIFMDLKKYEVLVANEKISLTAKEFDLLKILLENGENVCKREMLLDRVWGIDWDGETRTLDMHIKSLRTKLLFSGKYIVTHRGVGYTLRQDYE